jgi:hypothetical protein
MSPLRRTSADLVALQKKKGYAILSSTTAEKFKANAAGRADNVLGGVKFPKRKSERKHEESNAQRAVIKWFDLAYHSLGVPYNGLLMAIPNGGKRDAITAAMMKAEGVRAGACDLLLLVPRGPYHGLGLEMKATDGRLSDAQAVMGAQLTLQGYHVKTCYGSADAIHTIEMYLSLPTP